MNRVTIALAIVLLTAASNNSKAEVTGPDLTQQRPAINRTPHPELSATIKQARVETNGAKIFIINGRRVLVPSDANAEAVIKALKARYPGLRADSAPARNVTAIREK